MRYVITCMVLVLGMSIHAQEKKTLNVNEALAIAMKNNVQVITSENNYYSVEANVLPKRWGTNLPTLDLNARYGKSDQASTFITGSGVQKSKNNYSYSLNGNYILFDGFKKFGIMAQGAYDESSALYDLDRTKQDVALQVYQAYINVLKNQQLLRISEENLKRSQQQLTTLEERNKLGAQIISDVYKQRVVVGSDKLALSKARNNLNTSIASLNSLIGIDVNSEYQLKEISSDVAFDAAQYNFQNALQTAVENRKDYLSAKKKLESSRSALKISKSTYYPSLSAFATYSWADAFLPNGNDHKYTLNDRTTFGVNLSMNLFNGFQTNASAIQANQAVQTSKSNLDAARRKVELDIKIALLNMQTANEGVKLSEETVASAKEDLRLATERYNLGAGTLLDQITSNTGYATAEANHIQAVYDFLYAKQQYLVALGTLETK
jgi:outer membrane protein